MNLQGNTIFITGGGSGIGRGLAEAFHKLGNKVIVGGRRHEVLDETVAANPGMGSIVMDATSSESIQNAAVDLVAKYPELNVIINNAGVQRVYDFGADKAADQRAIGEEIDTNIHGVLRMVSAFLPHLKTRPAATVINLSSGLAYVPMARYPVYCATKAFVHSFTMSLRYQLQKTNVRVVELAPPWVKTDLDASHSEPTVHEGMQPMPLPDFIAAAMEELRTNDKELHVAGAKFLYDSGVGEKISAVFAQINH